MYFGNQEIRNPIVAPIRVVIDCFEETFKAIFSQKQPVSPSIISFSSQRVEIAVQKTNQTQLIQTDNFLNYLTYTPPDYAFCGISTLSTYTASNMALTSPTSDVSLSVNPQTMFAEVSRFDFKIFNGAAVTGFPAIILEAVRLKEVENTQFANKKVQIQIKHCDFVSTLLDATTYSIDKPKGLPLLTVSTSQWF